MWNNEMEHTPKLYTPSLVQFSKQLERVGRTP